MTAGPGNRKDVFRQAKQAYDLRSRIVHGDQGKIKDDNSIFTVTAGVGELLRMSLMSLEALRSRERLSLPELQRMVDDALLGEPKALAAVNFARREATRIRCVFLDHHAAWGNAHNCKYEEWSPPPTGIEIQELRDAAPEEALTS